MLLSESNEIIYNIFSSCALMNNEIIGKVECNQSTPNRLVKYLKNII